MNKKPEQPKPSPSDRNMASDRTEPPLQAKPDQRADESCCCPPVEQALQPEFFKSLCDAARVDIVCRLANCCEPQSVSQIAACCPTDISVVSRHLTMLREAGILKAAKSGKQVHYSVRYGELAATLRQMADAIEACCPEDEPHKTETDDDNH